MVMKMDFELDAEILIKFIKAADSAANERGKTIWFICPTCGSRAKVYRSSSNGHLHAYCSHCEICISQ
jgi:ferredoxin